MKLSRHRLLKRLAIATVIAVFLLPLLLALLHTPPVKREVLRILVQRLEQASGTRIAVASLDYNLLRMRFVLKDIQLTAGEAHRFPPLFKARELVLEIPLSTLMGKGVVVKKLLLRSPEIDIYRGEDGISNAVFAGGGTEPIVIPPFQLDRVEFNGMRVRYRDIPGNLDVSLPHLSLTGHCTGGSRHLFSLQMRQPGTVTLKDTAYPVHDLSVSFVPDNRNFGIKTGILAMGQGKFQFSGKLEDFNSPLLEASLKGQVAAADIAVFLPVTPGGGTFTIDARLGLREGVPRAELRLKGDTPNLRGNLRLAYGSHRINGEFDLHIPMISSLVPGFSQEYGADGPLHVRGGVGGSPDDPAVNATVRGNGLRVRVMDDKWWNINLDGRLTAGTRTMDIHSLSIRHGGNRLHVSGAIPFAVPGKPVRLRIHGGELDAAPFAQLFNYPLPAAVTLSPDVVLEKYPGAAAPRVRGEMVFAIGQTGQPGVRTVMTATGSAVLLSPWPVDIRINAAADCSALDGFIHPVRAQGNLSALAHITGTIEKPVLTGNLELEEGTLRFSDRLPPVESLNLRLEAVDNVISLETRPFRWGSGTLTLSGRLFSSSPSPGTGAALSFTFEGMYPREFAELTGPAAAEMVPGPVKGEIKISGPNLDMGSLSGSAVIHTDRLLFPGYPALLEGPVKIGLEQGLLRLDKVKLAIGTHHLELDGELGLSGNRPLQANLTGSLDLKALQVFLEGASVSGTCGLNLSLSGPLDAPALSGFIDVTGGGLRYMDPRLLLNNIGGRLSVENGMIRLEQLSGNFNGGRIIVGASAGLNGLTITDPRLTVKLDGIRMDYPEGLVSQLDARLTFIPAIGTGQRDHLLEGEITVMGAHYRESFNPGSRLIRYLTQPPAPGIGEETPDFFDRLRLNLHIGTQDPVLIDNDIARAELAADLKLTGTLSQPRLAGRLNAKEGGSIRLGATSFSLERGAADFIESRSMEPELDVAAVSRVANHDINLKINGPLRRLTAVLTSTPPLPEPDIIALLVTGRTQGNAPASLLGSTGNLTLAYLNSTVSGKLEKSLGQLLGLQRISIDGSLIPSRQEPGARLTVGTQVAAGLELIMSQSLRQSGNRTWLVYYRPRKGIDLQGMKDEDNHYMAGFNQELAFDLKKTKITQLETTVKTGKKPSVIDDVTFSGDPGLPVSLLGRRLTLKKGGLFDFFKFRQDIESLRGLYLGKHYLDVELDARRQGEEGKTSIHYTIHSGPRVFLRYSGAKVSRRFRMKAEKNWANSVFEEQKITGLMEALRRYFVAKGYYQVRVDHRPPLTGSRGIVHTFNIERGVKYRRLRFRFTGNPVLPNVQLTGVMKRLKSAGGFSVKGGDAEKALVQFYRRLGYLDARVSPPEMIFYPEIRETLATFSIQAGPQYKLGPVTVTGNSFFPASTLLKAAGLSAGRVYFSDIPKTARGSIEDLYWSSGFNQARVELDTKISREDAQVGMTVGIEENSRNIVKDIRVSGNSHTKTSAILKQLAFKSGDAFVPKVVGRSRTNLYKMGVFNKVAIETAPGDPAGKSLQSQQHRILVTVEESKPMMLKYGISYHSERFLGADFQLAHNNLSGRARLLGFGLHLDKRLTDFKLYFRSPYFLKKKVDTEVFAFVKRSKEAAFTIDRSGITLQQQVRLGKASLLSYNYTYERTRTFDWDPQYVGVDGETGRDGILHLGHITGAVVYDTRDNLFDAQRGLFLSNSLMAGAGILGSDARFIRYFGEISLYKPLASFLTYATALRIGLATAFGGELALPQRFFAGGGNSLRGYKDGILLPAGGEGLFLLKNELRFQVTPWLGAVLFADIGNVYHRAANFNPFETRKSAGFGFRIHTFLLFRFDWGFKLDRRHGESASRIFVSIGQSF